MKKKLLFTFLVHFSFITLYTSENKPHVSSLVDLASYKASQEYSFQKNGFKQLRKKGVPFGLAVLVASKINSITTLIDQGHNFKQKDNVLSIKKGKLESLYGLEHVIKFFDYQAIIKIDFSHKNISYIPTNCFDAFGSLQSLDLSHNNLQRLSSLICTECSSLQSLNLSHNHIDKIPAHFLVGLTVLQSLNLSHNKIKNVPEKILKDFPKMQSVNLSHNKINKLLPENLKNLPTLQYVNLSANQLKSIPKSCFTEVPQLKSIRLHGNNIHKQNIPRHIKDVVKM